MITEESLLEANYAKEEDVNSGKTYFVKQISDVKGIRYFIIVGRYSSVADKDYHYEGVVEYHLSNSELFRVEKVEYATETVQSMEKFFEYVYKVMLCKRCIENKIITK